MRTYDPIEEFDECLKSIQEFQESHRIDPYTPEEIAAMSKPKEPNVCKMASKNVEAPEQKSDTPRREDVR